MTAEIIDGNKIARKIREKTASQIKKLFTKHNIHPKVVTIKIGSDPSSDLYLRLREKACDKVDIKYSHELFPKDVSEEKVLQTVEKLNENPEVHGILVQLPILSDNVSEEKLINAIDPSKDVEGLHPSNIGRLFRGDEHIIPCTPLAVLNILDFKNVDLKGKNVAIVNHSNIVGKPLAGLFLNRNSTVSVCHVFTDELKKYTSKADILVSAAGVPDLITNDLVKKDAFVLDVGIVKTDDGVTGDIDFEEVKEKAGFITPVPGGVGPVTVACSLLNMVKTFENSLWEKKR
ncbi:MAG: tetrahydrofolate dehydrogenase/cyclohydrolase catalytic domain-containing protein [Candidatus Thermoplasmatota archaeon]